MYDLLKKKDKGLKHPMAHARGLGSAHDGLHEWIAARVTAVAGLFLTVWFAVSAINLIGAGYDGFVLWLARPLNAMLMSGFVIASYTHAKIGLQVIIEDYVHNEGAKIRELLALKLLYWMGMIATLFCIAKIAFGVSA